MRNMEDHPELLPPEEEERQMYHDTKQDPGMNTDMNDMRSPIMPGWAMHADITLAIGSGGNTKDLDWEVHLFWKKQALYQYL